ncbi:MAG: hypothetical protein R2844_06815 [Caldilineales bacterium]
MNDVELLQRFEPIVRYTKGEMFFPTSVKPYVNHASLWMRTPAGKDQQLVPPGELNLDVLAEYSQIPEGHVLYMNLVDQPLSGLAYQRWRIRPDRDIFSSAGRLARVPLVFRIVDSFFKLTFLVRGQVPRGFAAAAQVQYEALQKIDPRRVYYGRVVRDSGWIVLQYLFFMTMNDWRSSFNGVNDHETDWEQIFVYAYEDEQGNLEPRWVAYASHDFKGDDLRRRWDDPLLDKEGTHPVVYAGAGSHASYFERGEYLVGIAPAFLKPVEELGQRAREFWYEQLRMGREDRPVEPGSNRPILSIPHVDFARGDGKSIGPGQPEPWSPVLISDEDPWVDKYRGLWGLDTRDVIGGERAPSGPKYNRDGSVRQSWNDPLGWAGMDKVPTPPQIPLKMQRRAANLQERQQELQALITEKRGVAESLHLDITALRSSEYGEKIALEKEEVLSAELKALEAMQRERIAVAETLKALKTLDGRRAAGEETSPTAHIRAVHHPDPPASPHARIIDIWAAVSGALTLLLLALLLIFRPPAWPEWILVVLLVFAGIEATTRGHLTNYLLTTTLILAVVAAVILVIEFWQVVLVLIVVGVVLSVIAENLRELRSS